MIVKNEADIITRCLEQSRQLIQHVWIEDTGSTDGTQRVVQQWLKQHEVPGTIYSHPWQNFAYNRTHAFETLRQIEGVDFALVMDADDEIFFEEGALDEIKQKAETTDAFSISIVNGPIKFERIQLVRNVLPFAYRGVIHEFIESPLGARHARLEKVWIRSNRQGARSKNPQRYQEDAQILQQALKTEADEFLRTRYTFYLAQSLRDAKQPTQAIPYFLERSQMGHWKEEVYCALTEAVQLSLEETQTIPESECIQHLSKAIQIVPLRAEAYYWLVRLLLKQKNLAKAHAIAQASLPLQPPPHGLFVKTWIYKYGLKLEAAKVALKLHQTDLVFSLCNEIITQTDLPQHVLDTALELQKETLTLKRSGANWQHMKVSIITPTKNRECLLQHIHACVTQQTHANIEWLVLDNSPIPSIYLSAIKDTELLYEHDSTRMTIGAMRNRLVAKATGEIIIHFDDDDYYCAHYVETMLTNMLQNQVDMINLSGFHVYDHRNRFFGYTDSTNREDVCFVLDGKSAIGLLHPDSREAAMSIHDEIGYGFTYCYKRAVWLNAPFPDQNWQEDSQFALKASEKFRLGHFADRYGLVLHVIHSGSTSKCFSQYRLPGHLLPKLFSGFKEDKRAGKIAT